MSGLDARCESHALDSQARRRQRDVDQHHRRVERVQQLERGRGFVGHADLDPLSVHAARFASSVGSVAVCAGATLQRSGFREFPLAK
jgi:hypothetical protein